MHMQHFQIANNLGFRSQFFWQIAMQNNITNVNTSYIIEVITIYVNLSLSKLFIIE